MEKFELQTEFDCLVATEKEQVFISSANTLILEDETFAVYPATRKVLPFVVNRSKKRGNNFCFLQNGNKTYCFLFASGLSKKIVEKVKVEKEEVEVLISHSQIELKSKNDNRSFDFEERAKKYKVLSFQTFLIVHLFFSHYEQVILFCPSSSFCKSLVGTNFEFQNDTITFVEEPKDFAKSKITKKITLQKENIKEESTSLENEVFFTKPESVCFCFLECIKNQNFSLAKEFLSPTLQEGASDNLKDYFKKPFKFFALSLTEFALVYPEEVKTISFSLENVKIIDFELV